MGGDFVLRFLGGGVIGVAFGVGALGGAGGLAFGGGGGVVGGSLSATVSSAGVVRSL